MYLFIDNLKARTLRAFLMLMTLVVMGIVSPLAQANGDRLHPQTYTTPEQPTGSQADADAAAKAAAEAKAQADAVAASWNSLSQTQRQALWASLSVDVRNVLQQSWGVSVATNATGNVTTLADVKASSTSTATGNSTTTTVGGVTYSVTPPIAGAYVQLPPTSLSQGNLDRFVTTCGPDFKVVKERDILATTNTAAGLWTNTRPNGEVFTIEPSGHTMATTAWQVVGQEANGMLVEERMVNGFQAVIYSYIINSAAASGGNLSLRDGAGAISGSGGVQVFGNHILKFACSYRETRKLTPPPVEKKVEAAPAAAVQVATERVKTFEEHRWACWYGDPAKRPAKTASGVPVRQCSVPTGLVEGRSVRPLVPQEVETFVGASATAGVTVNKVSPTGTAPAPSRAELAR
jgi:hypothetical protein